MSPASSWAAGVPVLPALVYLFEPAPPAEQGGGHRALRGTGSARSDFRDEAAGRKARDSGGNGDQGDATAMPRAVQGTFCRKMW